uniref:Putative secreted protein n=1 Tax=Ixodes ricinus TaxID=34613 RepID=A0A6B0UKJ6_IXORI
MFGCRGVAPSACGLEGRAPPWALVSVASPSPARAACLVAAGSQTVPRAAAPWPPQWRHPRGQPWWSPLGWSWRPPERPPLRPPRRHRRRRPPWRVPDQAHPECAAVPGPSASL